MPIFWNNVATGAQRVGVAFASTPTGQRIVSEIASAERDVYWLAAGWVGLGLGFAWLSDSEPVKPHEDVHLPEATAWYNVNPILCGAHPYWDCYAVGGDEGCLGRSV